MVIRSPKWFRKIFDFEFVTGKDLYPEAQLQRKKIEQKELDESIKQKNLLKSWNDEWSKLLDNKNSDLRHFFEKYLREKGLYKTHLSYQEGIKLLKKTFEGKKDYFIINDFVSWLTLEQKRIADLQERERQARLKAEAQRRQRDFEQRQRKLKEDAEQREIQNFLDDLLRRTHLDFTNNPYSDKITTDRIRGSIKFTYKFESGERFSLWENELVYEKTGTRITYTLGLSIKGRFIDLANDIIRRSVNRTVSKPRPKQTDTTNPHLKRLNTLNEQIKIRETQLNKLSKTDPSRESLKNELDTYKRIRDKIKKEHSL